MEQFITLISIIHVVVAVLLVTIVLLQDSKGGMAQAFGGGSSQTFFGATGGANFLVKFTRGLAVVFMITCMSLTFILSSRGNKSVVDNLPPQAAPAAPEAAPAPAKK